MRFFLLVICFFIAATGNSQSIYELKLKSNNSIEYDALLLLYSDGTGIMRVKHSIPDTLLFEQQLIEKDLPLQDNMPEPTELIYTGSNMKSIKGSSTTPQNFDVHFSIINNEAQPSAISNGTLEKATFIPADNLTRSLVQKYFTASDPLYKNLFDRATRGLNLNAIEKKTRIHLIIVANTNDATLSEACKIDMERVETTFYDVTDFLGISPMNVIKIEGATYNRANVLKAINALKAPQLNRNDIIIFYYSGHGFRLPDKKTAFPLMDLRANNDQDYLKHYLSIDTVYQLIKAKRARMNLVISDCCNWEPGMQLPFIAPDVRARGSDLEWDPEKLRTLFLNPKRTSMLATAADKNQLAVSNKTLGSFFFKYFSESLSEKLSKGNRETASLSDWRKIFETAQQQTFRKSKRTYCSKPFISQNICNAFPIFLIE